MTDRHRVVVSGLLYRIVEHKPEFLILRRPLTAAFWPGVWAAPGGGVELEDFDGDAGGYAERALLRELTEELGPEVDYELPNLLGHRGFVRADGVGIVVLIYIAKWVRGEAITTAESMDTAWVTFADASGYNLIGDTLGDIGRAAELVEPF
jgi:ADP-ribose pyrophosphatase YjhB (NUDIX family)